MKISAIARRSLLGSAIAASALIASGNASAAAVVTGFELLDASMGSLDSAQVDNMKNTVDIAKTFTSVGAMSVRLTVGHGTGNGGPLAVSESIKNMTGQQWVDYHISIENAPQGDVFPQFSKSTLSGFTLDKAPSSGPRNLNFTGSLADGATAAASFMLSLNDPGKGKSYTLDLVQRPSVVPIPMAAYLFGSGLLGLVLRRRTTVS